MKTREVPKMRREALFGGLKQLENAKGGGSKGFPLKRAVILVIAGARF